MPPGRNPDKVASTMKLHEREKVVHEAKMDLAEKVLEWMQTHRKNLTTAEELKVVSGEFGDYMQRMAKYAIRRERHGDENQPGGLA